MKATTSQLKMFYQDFKRADVGKLDDFYDPSVIFKDPIHELHGLSKVQDYMNTLGRTVDECRFEYLDEIVDQHQAYIKWNMHFRHKKFGKRTISVKGISHLHFQEQGLICFHEDVYDMGEMLYENIPLLGKVLRFIKNKLGQS